MLVEGQVALKKALGNFKGGLGSLDTRDTAIDFENYWTRKTGISAAVFVKWIAITTSKFYDWKKRFGTVNEHNSFISQDIYDEEKTEGSRLRKEKNKIRKNSYNQYLIPSTIYLLN